MLAITIRKKLTDAMRANDKFQKNLLRIIIGETERSSGGQTDENYVRIIRKLVEGNNESRIKLKEAGRDDESIYLQLETENEFFNSFMPKLLNSDETIIQLKLIADTIKTAKNGGQAIGLAMKHF